MAGRVKWPTRRPAIVVLNENKPFEIPECLIPCPPIGRSDLEWQDDTPILLSGKQLSTPCHLYKTPAPQIELCRASYQGIECENEEIYRFTTHDAEGEGGFEATELAGPTALEEVIGVDIQSSVVLIGSTARLDRNAKSLLPAPPPGREGHDPPIKSHGPKILDPSSSSSLAPSGSSRK